MPVVYLSLGSNLGDRRAHLVSAIGRLQAPDVRVTGISHIYETEPVGDTPEQMPPYLNCAARIVTTRSPYGLLEHTQSVEQQGARVRTLHWGPRTIDIDIILYDAIVEIGERLTIPHPRAAERAFVLRPLQELDANLRFPDGQTVADLLAREGVAAQKLVPWGDPPEMP